MSISRNKFNLKFLFFSLILCALNISVFALGPIISSFSPTYGKTGDSITIKGSGFTGITGTNSVKFGITSAAGYRIVNDTTIRAKINNGSSGSISVTKSTLTSSLPGFIYCGPLNYSPTFKNYPLNVSCGSSYTYTINKVANAT